MSVVGPLVRCHGASQSIRNFDSAIAYIFSAQAVLVGDERSEWRFCPSILVLSKVLNLLTADITEKFAATTGLVLRRREGQTIPRNFSESSFRCRDDKPQLTPFRVAIIR